MHLGDLDAALTGMGVIVFLSIRITDNISGYEFGPIRGLTDTDSIGPRLTKFQKLHMNF